MVCACQQCLANHNKTLLPAHLLSTKHGSSVHGSPVCMVAQGDASEEGKLLALGQLMDASHDSCAKL
jgi:hypothetical protein